MRAKHAGMQRNACIALGNRRDPQAVPALGRALQDAAPLVRGHAAWALGQIGGELAEGYLRQAQSQEEDSEVLAEIADAWRTLQNLPVQA